VLGLPRRKDTPAVAIPELGTRPQYVAPPARELRRERKALLAAREERLRDLGGLALEMYKRDRFVASLVVERCAELVAIEARIHEIDALLEGTTGLKGGAVCVCGAPLLLGARYCATCGREIAPPARPAEPTATPSE
jgi:hypothetical protein